MDPRGVSNVPPFRPGWLPTLAMAVAVMLLGSLGVWQLRRLEEKRALLARFEARASLPPEPLGDVLASHPDDLEYRRVWVAGRYDRENTILLLHVGRELREGARVLTPLLPESPGPALLVDRGWIPDAEIEAFRERDTGAQRVRVVGVLRRIDFGDARPGSAADPRWLWNRFRPDALQAQLPYRLAPVLLQREDDGSDRLPLGGFDPPTSRVDHWSYAVTWFGLAAAAFATWVALGLKQGREARPLTPPGSPGAREPR